MVKFDGILNVKRLIVRHPQQHPVSAEIFDKVHLLYDLAWIGARATDKQRHTFFNRFHCGYGEGFKFIKKQVVAFAIGTRCGDVVDAILDDLIDAFLEIVHRDGLGRANIDRLRCGKGGHHSENAIEFTGSYHWTPP